MNVRPSPSGVQMVEPSPGGVQIVQSSPSGLRNTELVDTGPATPIADLDALPFPALYPDGHGIEPRAQYPYVVTSRGCPAKCSFCSSPEFWGSRVRFRSAENILDELELLRNRFGILYVSFRDDVFALSKQRVIDLCRGMIDRRLCLLWDCQTRVNAIDEERLVWMKRAGALVVQYGIESGSQKVLDRLQKGQLLDQIDRAAALTRKVGLVLSIYLITGVPGETEDDLRATEEMIRRIRPHDGIVTPLAVFPGTSLWEEYRSGTAIADDFWEGVGHDGVFVRPDRFTEEAVLRLSTLLETVAPDHAYTSGEFTLHREVTGPCYAADLMEGELLERSGEATAAAALYEDLVAREPWNPWPCLRLGRLALAASDPASALRWLDRTLALVPEFEDARTLRAEATRHGSRAGLGSRGAGASPDTTAAYEDRVGDLAGASRRSSRGFQSYPPPPRVERVDEPC